MLRFWLLACLPVMAVAGSIPYQIPASIRQGETLHVLVPQASAQLGGGSVKFSGQQVPLFAQEDRSVLGLMPVPVTLPIGEYPLEICDRTGRTAQVVRIKVEDAHFPIQNIVISKQKKALRPLPGEMRRIQALKEVVSPVRFWQEPLLVPTPDCMNSRFGVLRYHNGQPTGTYHKGIDLRSPKGRPVVATADGVVKISRMLRLHGGTVGIDHGQGLTSLYLHLSRVTAGEGRRVRRGTVIGYVGATGFATGPHLHWQVFANGVPVNPVQWISAVPACTAQ